MTRKRLYEVTVVYRTTSAVLAYDTESEALEKFDELTLLAHVVAVFYHTQERLEKMFIQTSTKDFKRYR